MNVLQLADRLQFSDDLAFNEKIQTMFADLVVFSAAQLLLVRYLVFPKKKDEVAASASAPSE